MRSRARRSLAMVTALGALALVVACGRILGIEPPRDRDPAAPLADAGDPADDAAGDLLPPLGQPDAACGDTTSDPKNCGACGLDCRGGKCDRGRCAPSVFVFGLSRPTKVVATESGVYWTERTASGGAVRRCDVDGCPNNLPRTLFQASDAYSKLVVRGDEVFALRSLGVDVCRSLGCAEQPRRLEVPASDFVVVDGTLFYVKRVTEQTREIWRCNGLACSTGTVRQVRASGHTLAALGSDVFVLDNGKLSEDQATIVTCPGGNCAEAVTLVSAQPGIAWSPLYAFPNALVWRSTMYNAGELAIRACEPKTCAGGARDLVTRHGWGEDFASDGEYLYWVDSEYSSVERLAWNRPGAKAELLLTNQGLPTGLSLHDGALYIARQDYGDIVRYVPPP